MDLMREPKARNLVLFSLCAAAVPIPAYAACSERKKSPRHGQCWWHELPRARTIDYCGEIALEGAQAHEGHECGFVTCVEAASADQCLGPNGGESGDKCAQLPSPVLNNVSHVRVQRYVP
jgi:hypothetical protein